MMNTHAGILIGIDGVIGLEYTLEDIPLNFAFGVGPSIQLTHRTGSGSTGTEVSQ